MACFLKDFQFTFDTTSSFIPFKRKQEIRRKIVENGGTISYILNKKTDFVISADPDIATTYKGRMASKLSIPIVSLSFIDDCVKKRKLLESDKYLLVNNSIVDSLSLGVINDTAKVTDEVAKTNVSSAEPCVLEFESLQNFPRDYEIAKKSWFKKVGKDGFDHFVAIELHVAREEENKKMNPKFRIFTHTGILKKNGIECDKKECRFSTTCPEKAVDLYAHLHKLQDSFEEMFSPFPPWIGSDQMMLISIENQSFDQNTCAEVCALVHCLWEETIGELTSLLSCPVEKIKQEDVFKAEAALLLIRKSIYDPEISLEKLMKFSDDFYSLIPHRAEKMVPIDNKRLIVKKEDLCQLIKDMLNMNEVTGFSSQVTDVAKYKALRCHLQILSHSCDEYENILNLIQSSTPSDDTIKVRNIFTVHRPVEAHNFHDYGFTPQLFHSSRAENILGILSRGLLLPNVVVKDYGGQRTDIGHLGAGIYFAGDSDVSAQYSYPSRVLGSRFMFICDVSLGEYKDFTKFTSDLNEPPDGFQSCHGVARYRDASSEFEDDEYTVYNVNQQKIRYLVEFTLPEDKIIETIARTNEVILGAPINPISLDEPVISNSEDDNSYDIAITDIENIEDPLNKVKAGLQCGDSSSVPLKSVHIRAKVLDLCAKVVVMQVYKNARSEPIEAKYVFPLDDMAAVCGFEAFINGKHIIGEVKEKEQAHKEYKKAISEGHGAYLMDEESPDVFTVSVGNIPSGATVVIKISYVTELTVEEGDIKFYLPGSLAPWKQDQALLDATQDMLDSYAVKNTDLCDLSIHISIEMPFDIRLIRCPSHQIKIKKTAAKAVVQMEEGQIMDVGFQLLIRLAEIHVPRMWVEKHPEKSDSQACMLSFYPEFETEVMDQVEIIFLLDLSCSMKGVPLEDAKKILLLTLNKLQKNMRFNIIAFGGTWYELFPISSMCEKRTLEKAFEFVKHCRANMGASDVWKVLKALNLLPVSADVRNIVVISDGHWSEEETTFNLAVANKQSSRIFTCGVGSYANRFSLRTLSTIGAGASEYFDSERKSKWRSKIENQLLKCQQPVLVGLSVAWKQYDNEPPQPKQAPKKIMSLFNGCRQVVYGFVPFCTQATLHAEVNGKEISTMVSTSELCSTTGKILHQLTARALINDWESGTLGEDHVIHQAEKQDKKNYIIEISKEYSVTSRFTSFVAIEERHESDVTDIDAIPDVQDIIDKEDVDILPYITWLDKESSYKSEEDTYDEIYEKDDVSSVMMEAECFYDGFSIQPARSKDRRKYRVKIFSGKDKDDVYEDDEFSESTSEWDGESEEECYGYIDMTSSRILENQIEDASDEDSYDYMEMPICSKIQVEKTSNEFGRRLAVKEFKRTVTETEDADYCDGPLMVNSDTGELSQLEVRTVSEDKSYGGGDDFELRQSLFESVSQDASEVSPVDTRYESSFPKFTMKRKLLLFTPQLSKTTTSSNDLSIPLTQPSENIEPPLPPPPLPPKGLGRLVPAPRRGNGLPILQSLSEVIKSPSLPPPPLPPKWGSCLSEVIEAPSLPPPPLPPAAMSLRSIPSLKPRKKEYSPISQSLTEMITNTTVLPPPPSPPPTLPSKGLGCERSSAPSRKISLRSSQPPSEAMETPPPPPPFPGVSMGFASVASSKLRKKKRSPIPQSPSELIEATALPPAGTPKGFGSLPSSGSRREEDAQSNSLNVTSQEELLLSCFSIEEPEAPKRSATYSAPGFPGQRSSYEVPEHSETIFQGCVTSAISHEASSSDDEPYLRNLNILELEKNILALQSQDGSWLLCEETLCKLLEMSTQDICDVLKMAGAESLGRSTFHKICCLVATIIVLAFLRRLMPNIYVYQLLPPFNPEKTSSEKAKKALKWLKDTDKSVPCVWSRLWLGSDWEDMAGKWLHASSGLSKFHL